jgi:hypothetical protein
MELDPGIHIVMHSVLSLKIGCDNGLASSPLESNQSCAQCLAQEVIRGVALTKRHPYTPAKGKQQQVAKQ